jgi:hypothetical protein
MIAEGFKMVFDMGYNMGHDAAVSMIPYGRICYVEAYVVGVVGRLLEYRAGEYLDLRQK